MNMGVLRRMPGLVRVRSADTALPIARRARQVRSIREHEAASSWLTIAPLAVYPRSIRLECSDAESSPIRMVNYQARTDRSN
jgi:hypothetical protein